MYFTAQIISFMKKILFVCLGNICRSPLAEAIFLNKVREKKLQHHFLADSCGTANYHVGHTPDPRTIKNAFSNGVTIHHVGRQLHKGDLEVFDVILAMDESNLSNILRLPKADEYRDKIKLLRTYDPERNDDSVPDPYYGTEKDFQEVFEILDRSMEHLLQELTGDTGNI